ncbi:class E sortase [Actinomadura decatromicini]|uniref:Class E sortase n=1 Tax=Actinomadura decatromicini TaxID=2604572 RepID=A0A5D3FQ69_9ACTN|nr:class E sortase [Actinomadura decatromicini]TYK50967.1 class E sortase [Actinomadura decatromicini]
MLDRKSLLAAGVAACCSVSLVGVPQARAGSAASPAAAVAAGRAAQPKRGALIGKIWIPRMGLRMGVWEGVSQRVLQLGPGHYPWTGLPGRDGNTVLLGHRTTWRHPFNRLDLMRGGDRIVLKYGRTTYTYRARTKRVIDPMDRRALEPVPFKARSAPHGQWITLITCTPKGSDRHRLVVVGKLYRTSPKR